MFLNSTRTSLSFLKATIILNYSYAKKNTDNEGKNIN